MSRKYFKRRERLLRQALYASEWRFVAYDLPDEHDLVHHVIPVEVDFELPDRDMLIARFVYWGGCEGDAEQIVRHFEARMLAVPQEENMRSEVDRVWHLARWAVDDETGNIDEEKLDVILAEEHVYLTPDQRADLIASLEYVVPERRQQRG